MEASFGERELLDLISDNTHWYPKSSQQIENFLGFKPMLLIDSFLGVKPMFLIIL